MNRQRMAIILNSVIIAMVIFASIVMITGFEFLGDSKTLTEEGFFALQFFTVDSNILAGISSVILLIYYILLSSGKVDLLPKWVGIVRLCAVTGVTLTMLTTVFYLGFIVNTGYFSLFYNANLFFHLLIPLFCIASFIFFEDELTMLKKNAFYGLLPTALYSIYYVYNVLSHYDHGVSYHYDFYGFAQAGIIGMIISFIVMLGLTLLISFMLLLFKNLRRKDV